MNRLILFDFPHRGHGSGDEPGNVSYVAGHDNRLSRTRAVSGTVRVGWTCSTPQELSNQNYLFYRIDPWK